MTKWMWVGCFAMLGSIAGCTGAVDPPAEPPASSVTWHEDVAPIVMGHCAGCHTEGAIAPMSLDSYASAAPYASLMAQAVERGDMPPWGAVESDDCTPRHAFEDDPRLSPEELTLLRDWADQGAAEGDPAKAAALPAPMERTLSNATHELQAGEWHASGLDDEFVCYVLDPGLTEDHWLTGTEVAPGNFSVVHHVVVGLDADRTTEALAGPDGSYPCFNAPGDFIGGYTPGAPPFEMPEGYGVRIPAGSLIVLNMHYHPLATPGGSTDATALKLRLTTSAPAKEIMFQLEGNFQEAPGLMAGPGDRGGAEFRVPADTSGHTETMQFTIPGSAQTEVPLWAIFPHMHYLGVDLEARLERAQPRAGEPADECLVKASRYDFDWQRLYSYAAPIEDLPVLRGGDTVTLRCTYDNTLDNPKLLRALDEQGLDSPVDVFLGEDTLDEMCIAVFGVVLP